MQINNMISLQARSSVESLPLGVLEFISKSGRNSVVECQLPKLKVASSTLVARSISFNNHRSK